MADKHAPRFIGNPKLSSEFIDSMDGSLDAVRARWDKLVELHGLDANAIFWMLLNSLVMVGAENDTPPSTMSVYLRHLDQHHASILNLYRDQQGASALNR